MRISLSKRSYPTKPDFMTDHTLRFCSRFFDVNVEVTPEQLCQALVTGHQLYPPVKDTTEIKGKIPRAEGNVMGREYVMVDIESHDLNKIPEVTTETFAACTLAPTFVYASYSDGAPEKGHRYHLVWCFADTITDPMQNKDIWSRCRRVALEAIGEGFEDDENVSDYARICFGSFGKSHFTTNGYKLYNLSDFDHIEPFAAKQPKPNRKKNGATRSKSGATRSKSGVRKIDMNNIYDEGDHFGNERRMAVISALYEYYGDVDKVRRIYERMDPNRKDPGEGESIIASVVRYANEGRLRTKKIGFDICRMLKAFPRRHDYSKPIEFDATISVPEHISDRLTDVLANLGKSTLLVSPPGAGKTEFSKKLEGNVLVVQMLKSIVDSSKYPADWVKVYGNAMFPPFWETDEERQARELEAKRRKQTPKERREEEKMLKMQQKQDSYDKMNPKLPLIKKSKPVEEVKVVEKGPLHFLCTIDKLHHLDMEKLKLFDYIVVDESHIIFESSTYRTLGFVIPLFNELIASDWGGKLILMTGTPILEPVYFPGIRIINVIPEMKYNHTFTFHGGKSPYARLADFAADALRQGKKVFFPSNSPRAKTAVINRILKHHSDVELHTQDFCKDQHNFSDNIYIRKHSKVPEETNFLSCTVYLGVGLDINNDSKDWVVVMGGEWIGQQIVQFANRLRNRDLEIHCFAEKYNSADYDVVSHASSEIERRCHKANAMKTEGRVDKIQRELLKGYACIGWDNVSSQYVVNPLYRDIHLDWVDYRDFHKDIDNLRNYLESFGFTFSNPVEDIKEATAAVGRNSAAAWDCNEILAHCLDDVLRVRPSFEEKKDSKESEDSKDSEDLKLIDKTVIGVYIKNVRPHIRRLLKVFADPDPFANPDVSDKRAYDRMIFVVNSFLDTVYDEKLNREKRIFFVNKFRNFAECHKLKSKIRSYSQLFQNFYKAVSSFVHDNPVRTKSDIEEFISQQAKIYVQDATVDASDEILLKRYFKLFVSIEKNKPRYEHYNKISEYTLALTAIEMQAIIDESAQSAA